VIETHEHNGDFKSSAFSVQRFTGFPLVLGKWHEAMRNKTTEIKSKAALGIAGHLISRIACLGAVILICSSATAQNLFVSVSGASWGNPGRGSIYKFAPNGERTTFAVGLNNPMGLAFDEAGNLFVSDSEAIYKFTPDGVRTTFVSPLFPVGLAFDRAGNLFVADGASGSILKFTRGGVRSTFASGLDGPVGLTFDRAGNLFVTDGGDFSGHGHLYKFTPAGARSTVASGFITPNGLAFDSTGNLFLVDGGDIDGVGGAIYKFTPNGVRTTFVSADFFIDEFGLAIDSANNLFVPDLDLATSINLLRAECGASLPTFPRTSSLG
jgi:sugar lactone lactonase YvrE